MTAIFISDGEYLDHVPAVDLPAGAVVVQGLLVGITARPIAAGTLGSLALEGVFAMPRAPGAALPRGSRLFWDAAAQRAVSADGGGANAYLGVTVSDLATTDDTARVRLNH